MDNNGSASSSGIGEKWKEITKQVEQATDIRIAATPRALRNSAASAASDRLQNDSQVEKLMGHRSNGALRFYVNNAPDYLHEAVQAIGHHFFAEK